MVTNLEHYWNKWLNWKYYLLSIGLILGTIGILRYKEGKVDLIYYLDMVFAIIALWGFWKKQK